MKTSAGDTEWFRIGRGVRQGCVLLPNLFKGGVQIRGEVLNKLGFADDTSLVCNSKKELLGIVHVVRDKSAERDLLLKVKKKIMVVDKDGGDTNPFIIGGEGIEEVCLPQVNNPARDAARLKLEQD